MKVIAEIREYGDIATANADRERKESDVQVVTRQQFSHICLEVKTKSECIQNYGNNQWSC